MRIFTGNIIILWIQSIATKHDLLYPADIYVFSQFPSSKHKLSYCVFFEEFLIFSANTFFFSIMQEIKKNVAIETYTKLH